MTLKQMQTAEEIRARINYLNLLIANVEKSNSVTIGKITIKIEPVNSWTVLADNFKAKVLKELKTKKQVLERKLERI